MRLMPMSESELAWDLFYERSAGDFEAYRQWVEPQAGVAVSPSWCRVDVIWEKGAAGACVARFTRQLPKAGLNTRGHRHLRFFGTVGKTARLRLIVNGKVHELRGQGEPRQYTVPVGNLVRSLAFECVAGKAGQGAVSLIWSALVDMRRDQERLRHRGHYDETWDSYLVPFSQPPEPSVQLGLLFDQRDLARLRRRVENQLYRPWMDALRSHARELLTVRPESLIGRFACPPLHYTRPAERNGLAAFGGYDKSLSLFHHLAFVGLLDGDARMLRHAARWMLSLACCDYWYNDFAGELPGTIWHHRAFAEGCVCEEVALALDWAGGMLTPAGRELVRDAIARRGLARLEQDFFDPHAEYIRSMNQGLVFNTGRILGLLALVKDWPRAEARLRMAQDDAKEMFRNTFTADGGTVEGPAYWSYTMSTMLPGMIALARYRKQAVVDLLSPRFRQTVNYPSAFASLADPGYSLPIGDSGHYPVCSGSLAAMLAHTLPGAASNLLAALALRNPAWGGDPVLAVVFGPARLPKPTALVPEFRVLKATGQALVCRDLKGVGRVRLQFIGAPSGWGSHSHDDRGSLLLEADGQAIFVDRGIGHYSNPAQTVKRPEAHNLLVPDTLDRSVPRQNLAPKSDIAPRATCSRGRFRASMDTTGAWFPPVKWSCRTVVSPSPGVFELVDELTATRSLGACFHLHTPLAGRREGPRWVFDAVRFRVVVEPQWSVASASFMTEDMGIGKRGTTYGHLKLRVAPARRHRLVTRVWIEQKKRSETASASG